MASAVSPLTGSSGSTSAATSSSSLTGTAPSESVFLNLLVSQIQNQDPLNPSDSTQFVSQLAQFSELEQVIAIRGDTDTLATSATAASAATTAAGSATSSAGSAASAPSTTTSTSTTTTPLKQGFKLLHGDERNS